LTTYEALVKIVIVINQRISILLMETSSLSDTELVNVKCSECCQCMRCCQYMPRPRYCCKVVNILIMIVIYGDKFVDGCYLI